MELKDTVELMLSDDKVDNFNAEYYQISTRIEKLMDLLGKWDTGQLEYTPASPRIVLDEQLHFMMMYRAVLEERADREHIPLNDPTVIISQD